MPPAPKKTNTSKRNQFLQACLAFSLSLFAIYVSTAALLGLDYVKALAATAAVLVILVAVVVAIGRRFPNYFMYRGAIEFWSDLRARRDRRSRKT